MQFVKEKYPLLISLVLIFIVFFICAPYTVQTLDTGETVTNSYLYRLIHPPGYPIYTHLYFFWTNVFSFKSVFHSASILTVFLSVSTLYFIFEGIKIKSLQFLFPLVLASSSIFWRYSLLPDVFMLHCFIVSVFFYAYRKNFPYYILAYVFTIGCCNHQTTIFLFPFLINKIWQHKAHQNLRQSLMHMFLNIALYFAINLTLFLPDQSSITTIFKLESINDFFSYLLRKQYGTLKLTKNIPESYNFLIKDIFLENSILELFIYFFINIFSIFLIFKSKLNFRFIIPFLIYFGFYYFIFFRLTNTNVNHVSREIIERFFLFPQLMIAIITVSIFNYIPLKKTYIFVIIFFSILNIYSNIILNKKMNNFSQNTIIEDTMLNAMSQLDPSKDIFFLWGDTQIFATFYVQFVLKKYQDIIIFPKSIFSIDYLKKVYNFYKEKIPSPDYDEIIKSNTLSHYFYSLNKHFNFFALTSDVPLPAKSIQYLDLGTYNYLTEKHFDTIFKDTSAKFQFRHDINLTKDITNKYHQELFFYHLYSLKNFKLGNFNLEFNDFNNAKKYYQKSIEQVEYCGPCLLKLCKTLNDPNAKECQEGLLYKNIIDYSYFEFSL
ncbi:MAG: DUF2723 domain-containing protein [Halobacteriovoraceae bacterium]|nr:DUF2723 domain-containing protein [Halobacteriovoraceae bacterium]